MTARPYSVESSDHSARVVEEQTQSEQRVVAEAFVEICDKCGLPRGWTVSHNLSCVELGPDGFPEGSGDHEFVRVAPPAAPLEEPLGASEECLWENDEEGFV